MGECESDDSPEETEDHHPFGLVALGKIRGQEFEMIGLKDGVHGYAVGYELKWIDQYWYIGVTAVEAKKRPSKKDVWPEKEIIGDCGEVYDTIQAAEQAQ